MRRFYRARPADARKGDFGRVVVAGGSLRFTGAPTFNALAALRAGADLAMVVAPRRAADIIAGFAPDIITFPCDTSFPDPAIVREASEGADALVVGGGVERSARAQKALREIVETVDLPTVADAEALHALAKAPGPRASNALLLTPHGGEYQVLSGHGWPDERNARREAVQALAKSRRATVIVKGRWDFISDGHRVAIDSAGSPYLTKGGYGDLLAGAAGALLARGASAFDAARAAAWIVGSAGAMAAGSFGESTVASDALGFFPEVLPRARGRASSRRGS